MGTRRRGAVSDRGSRGGEPVTGPAAGAAGIAGDRTGWWLGGQAAAMISPSLVVVRRRGTSRITGRIST